MRVYPTVLLEHTTESGVHYDWFLTDPADPDGALWTARTGVASGRWAELGVWELEEIGRHRRHYLTYEGPISGGRGSVRHVDEGTASPIAWSEDRIVADVAMRFFRGRVTIERVAGARWRAVADASCSNGAS